MKEFKFSYTFSHIPPIMKRGRHVLIVIKSGTQFILGSKDIYPPGIYRFVGGGLYPEEKVENGAVREIKEELQINISENDLKSLAKFIVEAEDNKEKVRFETYLFYLETKGQELTASDDIKSLVNLNKKKCWS